MARIRIEHYSDGAVCEGDIALEGIRVFPMLWPVKLVGLRIGKKAVVYLDRQECLDVAEVLRKAAHDG